MTYQTVPNLTYEKLNYEWHIPKQNRDEFRRPVQKKPKPPKLPKQKLSKRKDKVKKEKYDKKSKSSKGTVTKEKKPKVKPEKHHKPTKEEKEEFERVRMEEEHRIKEEIAAEENKRFLFPLGLAADEEFFKNIFTDYISPTALRGKSHKKKKKE